jgi:hypothetical protein
MNMIATIPTERTFNAVVQPLYDANGKEVDAEIGRAVVRDDTGETISVCGPAFKPVQHSEVIDPILDHLHGLGYEVKERNPSQRSLYDLAGEKGAFLRTSFAKNGAVMRADIITGDFIKPTGASNYLQDGPDTMLFKTSIFNSHNGSLAVRVNTSYERLICMNGMTRPDFSAGVFGKHTQGFSIKAMQAQIENAVNGMHHDADTFGLWAKKRITREVAETMLQMTLAKLPNKPNGDAHFSERLVNKILEQFTREDQTVWGLYQAITWWQTHEKSSRGASAVTTMINRETRVSQMLRTPQWGALIEA